MPYQRDSEVELMDRDEILEKAQTHAEHKGNEAEIQRVNNILVRAQINQQLRLEDEIRNLRKSIDSFKSWSRGLTIVLVILSLSLLLVELNNMVF